MIPTLNSRLHLIGIESFSICELFGHFALLNVFKNKWFENSILLIAVHKNRAKFIGFLNVKDDEGSILHTFWLLILLFYKKKN